MWIDWKWTEEKPYPETLDTRVHVMMRDGWNDSKGSPIAVAFWHDEEPAASNWYQASNAGADIVAYKVVK